MSSRTLATALVLLAMVLSHRLATYLSKAANGLLVVLVHQFKFLLKAKSLFGKPSGRRRKWWFREPERSVLLSIVPKSCRLFGCHDLFHEHF